MGPIAYVILLIVFAPLGMVTGLVGGVMYGAKQRFLTAASPCLGVVGGAIIAAFGYAIAEGLAFLIFMAPAAGGVLGVFYAIGTWRRSAQR